jgi:hypothetical protein
MNAWPASGRDPTTYRKAVSMTKKPDEQTERAARADARALRACAEATGPYPEGTRISRVPACLESAPGRGERPPRCRW